MIDDILRLACLFVILAGLLHDRIMKHLNRVLFAALPGGKVPKRATDGSAGFDCYASTTTRVTPYSVAKIPLGFVCGIPDGYVGLLVMRSGVASKGLLAAPGGVGVIDSDYRGEVSALVATGEQEVTVGAGERIAQLVVVPCVTRSSTVGGPGELGETVRGAGGFGSTGVA